VAGIFLWSQIAWAADLPLPPSDPADDASGQMDPTELLEGQAAAESLVDTQNAIEDFEAADEDSVHHVYEGTSIQTMIDAAEKGDAVYVHEGVFNEHLILKQGVDLVGENRDTTVIHGDFQGSMHVIRAAGDNLIEGLTISGSGTYPGGPSSAVRVEGDNVKIRGNNIINEQDHGIYICAGSATLIEKNLIRNTYLGVQLPNDNTIIRYNTFADNGIAVNILFGEAPVVSSNIITGSTFQSVYEYACNRDLRQGYAVVEDNVLFNNRGRVGRAGSILPPAIECLEDGNVIVDPCYTDPACGDFSVGQTSPAYGRGAFLPEMLEGTLDHASLSGMPNTIIPVVDPGDGSALGYRIDYDNASYEELYNDGTLKSVFLTYYESGRLETRTLEPPDQEGNVYYHYIDEDFGGRGYGRVNETRSGGTEGILKKFEDHYEDTEQPACVKSYDRGNKPFEACYYSPAGRLLRKYDYIEGINYYYHESGRLRAREVMRETGVEDSSALYLEHVKYSYRDEEDPAGVPVLDRIEIFNGAGDTALVFDGTAGHVTVPDSDAFSFGDGLTGRPMTILVDLYVDGSGGGGAILSKYGEYLLGMNSQNQLYFQLWDTVTQGGAGIAMAPGTFIPEGRHQIAATFNGLAGRFPGNSCFYIDGGEFIEAWDIGYYIFNAMTPNDNDLIIGGYGDPLSSFWGGSIYDLKIFDTALSLAHIEEIYSGGVFTDDLIAHWAFGEGTGTCLSDIVGGNDGFIDGPEWAGPPGPEVLLAGVTLPEGGMLFFSEHDTATGQAGHIDVYGPEGNIIAEYELGAGGEILAADVYEDNEVLIRSIGSSGQTEYFYNEDNSLRQYFDYGINGGLSVFDAGDNVLYDYTPGQAEGSSPEPASLVSVTTSEGDVIRYFDGEVWSVTLIEDGSTISDITLDNQGDIHSAIIRYLDGAEGVVYGGKLLQIVFPDGVISRYREAIKTAECSGDDILTANCYMNSAPGDIIYGITAGGGALSVYDRDGLPVRIFRSGGEATEYENGHLKIFKRADGREYSYSYVGEEARSVLAGGDAPEEDTPVEIFYDSQGKLLEARNFRGDALTYDNGLPSSLVSGGGGSLFEFRQDSLGRVTEVLVERDSIKRTYDPDGNLASLVTADDVVVNFDQEGDISSVVDSDGVKYLYQQRRLSAIIDEERVTYTVDDQNRVAHATFPDGREYDYSYETDAQGEEIVVVHDLRVNAIRKYKDDLLYYQVNDIGLESFYEYEEEQLVSFTQKKGSKTVNEFIYEYSAAETTITSLDGSIRVFDQEDHIKSYHDTRGHVYKFYHDGEGNMISELAELHKEDGRVIHYFEGAVDHVDCPNGTVITNISFDGEGKLQKFTLVLQNGEVRTCFVDGEWTEIVTGEDTRLIYKGSRLAAVNTEGRVLRFLPDQWPDTITTDESEVEIIDFDAVSGSHTWRYQTHSTTRGFTGVSYDPSGDQLLVTSALDSSVSGCNQGEIYLDLQYYAGGVSGPLSLRGQEISFLVKLPEGALPGGKPLIAQVFAKDSGWRSQYGTEVTITQDGAWYRVSLAPSDFNYPWGIRDSLFDPDSVRLIGLRIKTPYSNTSFSGQIRVKDGNDFTLPEGETYIETPMLVDKEAVEPYVGAISGLQPDPGNPNYISWSGIRTYMDPGEAPDTGILDLEAGSWRAQDIDYISGVRVVERDEENDQWILQTTLKTDDLNYHHGETYVDLRYDITGYTYSGPLNLAGKQLRFKVKVPPELAGLPGDCWAQVYVKDEEYDFQYGTSVSLTQGNTWYTVTLTPQNGFIYRGETSENFDPARIVNIGVKISCAEGSSIDYEGPVYLQCETPPSALQENSPKLQIDANGLKQYARENDMVITFEEELGPEIELAKEHLPNYFKDDSWTMKTVYDPSGKIICAYKGNSRVEHFDSEGRLVEITDPEWDSVVKYSYDSEGNLVDIDYEGTRLKTRENIENAKIEIETKTAQALCDLGEAEHGAIAQVEQQIGAQIRSCDNAIGQLQSQLNAVNSWKPFWPWDKKKKNSIRADIERALQQTRDQRRRLVQAKAAAYEQIDADIATAREEIMGEYSSSMEMVLEREANAEVEILQQEVEQLLCVYYTKILGRNPGQAEVDSWMDVARAQGCLDPDNRIAFDVNVLKDGLLNSTEYGEKTVFNSSVRQAVTDFLYEFLNESTTEPERTSMLESLGLTASEIDSLNGASWDERDVDLIDEWLADNQVNFGRCAFADVHKYLEDKGISRTLEEIAAALILIDILAGAIDCFTEGALEISLYAMDRYINKQLEASQEEVYSSRLDYEDLVGDVQAGCDVIVHMDSDHYVIITGIDAEGNLTYYEPNNGAEGESITVDEVTFRMHWTGYAISERAPPAGKQITAQEALSVRGNLDFFFSWLMIGFAIFSTALSFIDNEVCQMVSKILGVASLVLSVFTIAANLPQIISGFFKGITEASIVLKDSLNIGFSIFKGSMQGIVANLPVLAFNTVTAISYNIALTQGLSFLNINSDIARLTSSFLTGGFMMGDFMINGFIPTGNFLTGALMASTRTGISIFGREAGIDPYITDLASTAACTLGFSFLNGVVDAATGDILTGLDAVSYTLNTTVLPNVTSELAYIGIQEFGETLGLDPRISYLAGIGIRSSLQSGLGTFGQGGGSPGEIWDAVIKEATQPTNLAIAFNLIGDAIGLDPLINNMMITAVAGMLDGFNENPENRIIGMFQGMFQNFWNASVRALTFGLHDPVQGGWNRDIQRDYALMNMTCFIEVVQQYGIEEAIENHLGNIFRDEAIRIITERGGISDFLTGDAEMVQEGGMWLKKINITDEDKLYLDPVTNNIVGRDHGNIKERGEYGTNRFSGGFGLVDGTIEEVMDSGTRMIYYVSRSMVIDKMEVYGADGACIQILAKDPETGLELNENGIPLGGIVADFENDRIFTYEYLGDSIDFEMNIKDPGNIQNVMSVDWGSLTAEEKEEVLNYYIVMNGINNQNPYDSPGYHVNFAAQLANADPLPREDIALVDLFNDMVPSISSDDLVGLVGDEASFLYADLRDIAGYIVEDEYYVGYLTAEYYNNVKKPVDLVLNPQFEDKREEIYNYLRDLNRGFFEDVGDKIRDGLNWIFKREEIADDIYEQLQDRYGDNFPADITGLCYSGSGDPFIHMINTHPELDVGSVVLVGTPIRADTVITNTTVDNLITIYGSEDDLVFDGFNRALRDGNFDGYTLFPDGSKPDTKIAIELVGVGHDYFYDPSEENNKEMRQKSSEFIAKITSLANDETLLRNYLDTNPLWIKKESDDKYTVTL